MVRRREFVKAGAAMAALAGLGARDARGEQAGRGERGAGGPPPQASDRLDQGPFLIDQDEGWFTIETTAPSLDRVRNFGMGLVGYTWEENGPALAVRSGAASLERGIEELAALPFVDVLYIRCDWRDVQSQPGRLDLHRVWPLTFDAARRHGLRVGVRVQMSNPEIQPARLAIPDFLKDQVPLVRLKRRVPDDGVRVEPRYDHPSFQRAFRELQGLLVADLDDNPLVEFVDLMMYGFWGEGHTSDWISPFPDEEVARRTFVEMTRFQLDTWKHAPLVVNTQPDISYVGNDAVLNLAVRPSAVLLPVIR
jgi:hypothetical protein